MYDKKDFLQILFEISSAIFFLDFHDFDMLL